MIAHARKGIYGESSFRNTSEHLRRRHFVRHRNRWEINEKIKSMCNFSTMNILNDDSIYVIGKFDIIFCRNVLIYFNQESKLKAVSNFFNRLKPDGVLFLGHSESLLNTETKLNPVYLKNSIIYSRPGDFI
jgi:chemotaxis protein methyltransferase CheR